MAQEQQPKCPVDHATRGAWMKHAEEQLQKKSSAEEKCPVDHSARQQWLDKMGGTAIEEPESCSSDAKPVYTSNVALPDEREISSIPRTGAQANWIYPSQKQFYEAMKRKNWDPKAKDMKSVVPIHNAVNERAWNLIQVWEDGQGGDQCGGIQLTSFKGDSKKLTPRARWKLFLGYEKPFDRHDWIISRCGKEVEYVIDFYSGKPDPRNPNAASFFLDVRPKLNSFEGVRMRVMKALGI